MAFGISFVYFRKVYVGLGQLEVFLLYLWRKKGF